MAVEKDGTYDFIILTNGGDPGQTEFTTVFALSRSPTFAYGPEPTSQPSNQDKITAEKLREIKSVVDNYKAKTISQETALKFLEALGVSSDEARKVLQ